MRINIAAPCNSLGYGVCSTNIVKSLDALGHEVALWPIGTVEVQSQADAEVLQRAINRTAEFDRHAPSVRLYHQFDLAQHVGKGTHAAFPIFELTKFTKTELHHLKNQDIVICPSYWAARIIDDTGACSPSDIRIVPFGVDTSIFKTGHYVPSPNEPTVFLSCGKWEVRKGHDVLVDVFNRAFSRSDNVFLIMNCHNPCFRTAEETSRYNKEFAESYKKSKLGDKINVIERRLSSQREVAMLMGHADCGVFLSRAEGWNLDAAEMMAMGKHLIITNYSAHTEYCTTENSRLVTIDRLEDAYDGVWFHGQGQWAHLGTSQLDQAVEHMRSIHKLKQEGQLGRNEAGIKTMQGFTWGLTAKKLVEALR